MPAGRKAEAAPAVRLSALYGALFLVIGFQLPFWPVWLQSRGLSAAEISAALAVGMVARIIAGPLVAYAADRRGERRRPIVALAGLAFAAYALFSLCHGFAAIVAVTLLASVLFPSIMPLADTLTLGVAAERRLDYGRVRLWGSLTFIGASYLGGFVLAWGGPDAILAAILGGCAASVVAGWLAPEAARPQPGWVPPDWRATWRLARHPGFLLFLFSASAVQASHGVYYAFGTLNWQHLGYADRTIGGLWALGVIAEIALFAVSSRAVRLFGPLGLIGLGGAAGLARWSLMTLDPGLPALAVLQILHAFTFGATHLGAMHFIARMVPAGLSATAQSLLAAMASGVVLGGATLLSGWLYARFGAGAYGAMALLAGGGGVGALILARRGKGLRASIAGIG